MSNKLGQKIPVNTANTIEQYKQQNMEDAFKQIEQKAQYDALPQRVKLMQKKDELKRQKKRQEEVKSINELIN